MPKLTPNNHATGLLWDTPDRRDKIYSASPKLLSSLSTHSDLRGDQPPIWDQSQLGSCVGHGTGAAFAAEVKKQGLPDFMPSRLDIYWGGRSLEGATDYDSGCEIRDAIKWLASNGVCPESEWPYDISKFTQQPPDNCAKDALSHLALQYESVPVDIDQIRACLTSGFPVVIGLTLYESFEHVDSTGIVLLPGASESILGGHCMLICGHDDNSELFITRNSWGVGFGDHGYVYLPYSYAANPAYGDDYWKLELVS